MVFTHDFRIQVRSTSPVVERALATTTTSSSLTRSHPTFQFVASPDTCGGRGIVGSTVTVEKIASSHSTRTNG